MEANREDDGQSNDRHPDDGHSDAEVAMDRELLCPICLALLYRPAILDQCQHRFCEPCLIRLARARINTCPICRSIITEWHLDEELHYSIANENQDVYIQRQLVEMISGIYEPPVNCLLPPVNSDDSDDSDQINFFPNFIDSHSDDSDSTYTLSSSSSEESVRSLSDSEAEDFSLDFNDRLEDYGRELWFLKLAMAIMMALILGLISGVLWTIFTLNGYGTR